MGDKNPKLSYAQQRAARQARVDRDAARKEAYEIRHATRAATMRKRTLPDGSDADRVATLPDGSDADRVATRALPEEDGSDGDGIDVRAPRDHALHSPR